MCEMVVNAAYHSKNIWSRIKHINPGFIKKKEYLYCAYCYGPQYKKHSAKYSSNHHEIDARYASPGFIVQECDVKNFQETEWSNKLETYFV